MYQVAHKFGALLSTFNQTINSSHLLFVMLARLALQVKLAK